MPPRRPGPSVRHGAWCLLVVVVAGCTPVATSNAGASGDGGAASGPPGASVTAEGLTCLGVLKCAAGCPDEGVDACVQGCVDQSTKSSQPITSAFVGCIQDNQCADATCVRAKCERELGACVADDTSVVAGKPSSTPAPATGALPAELVGLWSQVGLTSGMSYEFEADGKTTQAYKNVTDYGCHSEIALASSGVTNVTGDTLVYHRASGTVVMTTCGTTTSKPSEPSDIAYRYTLTPFEDGTPKLSLYLVNDDGTVLSPIELHR